MQHQINIKYSTQNFYQNESNKRQPERMNMKKAVKKSRWIDYMLM